MAETIADKKVFSLAEVMRSVKKTIESRYTTAFWVKAEMNKLNLYRHSGHCYPELVEKENGKVIAETKAILWSSDYQRIERNFRRILNEPLKDGIKILIFARITFDAKYGFALVISDIDPSFTLGDLQREKQETIAELKSLMLFEKNKNLSLPLLPGRIAVISVETSKGYADFLNIIEGNSWGYKFSCFLFPSLLQGEQATRSIMAQLQRIKKVIHHFDMVAIIRGGGGDIGLSCYNDLKLSKAICEFPIPVLTGIGHSTNETVVEMIAHFNAITPTKLAEFLIQKFHNFSIPVQDAKRKITEYSRKLLRDEKISLSNLARLSRSAASSGLAHHKHLLSATQTYISQKSFIRIQSERNRLHHAGISLFNNAGYLVQVQLNHLKNMEKLLQSTAGFQLKTEKTKLQLLTGTVKNLDPQNVLKRGYSITLVNGKSVKTISDVATGDVIVTRLADGELKSKILSVKNKK